MSNSLCQLAADYRGAIPEGGCMVETKVDGWRALYFPGWDGRWRLWSRNGHPIEGTEHIAWRLEQMQRMTGEPMVFDGEFQVDGTLAATKAWCERGWRLGGEAGIFHAFDCLPLAHWERGESPIPAYQRKATLKALWQAVEGDAGLAWEWRPGSHGRDEVNPGPVQIVEDEWAFTPADVLGMARRVWAIDGEGLMLKDAEAPYRRLRSPAWMKVKRENFHKWASRPIAA